MGELYPEFLHPAAVKVRDDIRDNRGDSVLDLARDLRNEFEFGKDHRLLRLIQISAEGFAVPDAEKTLHRDRIFFIGALVGQHIVDVSTLSDTAKSGTEEFGPMRLPDMSGREYRHMIAAYATSGLRMAPRTADIIRELGQMNYEEHGHEWLADRGFIHGAGFVIHQAFESYEFSLNQEQEADHVEYGRVLSFR